MQCGLLEVPISPFLSMDPYMYTWYIQIVLYKREFHISTLNNKIFIFMYLYNEIIRIFRAKKISVRKYPFTFNGQKWKWHQRLAARYLYCNVKCTCISSHKLPQLNRRRTGFVNYRSETYTEQCVRRWIVMITHPKYYIHNNKLSFSY